MGRRVEAPRVYGESDLSYEDYLKVPELLGLQRPLSDPPHHDEMLFIIIHQAYELWFKLILHEMDSAIRSMQEGDALRARHFLHRVVEVMRLLTQQIHILETMTPAEFLGFRDHLKPASGFQSVQFREIEFLAGLKEPRYLGFFRSDPELVARLERRLAGPDLTVAYFALLRKLGWPLPEGLTADSVEQDAASKRALLSVLLPIYERPHEFLPLYLLSESLVDLDETMALWREHHVRVVERIIGGKRGTGGSSGVEYLRTTLGKKAFPYLWEVRTVLGAGV